MPVITLPDGSQRAFAKPVSVLEVARDIGPGLAKATLAGVLDGKLVDTACVINEDAPLRIITEKDPEGLEIIRHSCAHLLAQAVKILYPSAQVTIGPVVENGFYYDFAFERPFTLEDLAAIEAKMFELAALDQSIERLIRGRNEAVAFFRQLGERYKAEIIAGIPTDDEISLYKQGDFIDLCRGPHVPNTGRLQAFKLTKLAGAYWRGDPANEMLQRIYGTAWADKKSLKAYLHRLEEAEKRDHRKLGRRLELFHFQEEAPGMPFWHAHGWTIYRLLIDYIREKLRDRSYLEVHTPQVIDRILWEKSGHMDKFSQDMFMTSSENREYAIKPMNCPAHVQIYNQGLKSYRDLPLRLAEFGCCHRNEQSGSLHGLMRVRTMTQDDAHIFCTEDQIQDEVSHFIDLLYEVYADFGFNEIQIRLATRPPQRVGSNEVWDTAETALATALNEKGLSWTYNHGEGAFYGPKIEFSLKDSLERIWQCGTIQVDFSMPGRLGATYVNERSEKAVPVMLHRAVLGSLERFIGILIEEYAGAFPAWLAPVQAVVLSITEKQAASAEIIAKTLKNQGFRVESDLRNETISLKIRDHAMQRVPYQVIIGAREVENNILAVRTRAGDDLGNMTLEAFSDRLKSDIACRGRNVFGGIEYSR